MKLKLSIRLAIAIVLAVTASFLFDQVLRVLIPPSPVFVVQRSWLVDAVVQARDGSLGTDRSRFFDIASYPEPPFPQGGKAAQFADDFRSSLARALRRSEADVRVRADTFSDVLWERSPSTPTGIIPTMPTLLGRTDIPTRDGAVLGRLEIAVRQGGGHWLVIRPHQTRDTLSHYLRNALESAGNLLILAVFSIWMARSIAVPLGRLASAAERLGREREPTLITGMRLPEFAAIADTFNAMQLRLKRYVDERVQMLAAISHDLRTPLTRLRLLAEYVPDEEQRTQLKSNVTEMETMVADALAFMRGEARREPMEAVDLASLLISLADTCKDMGEDVAYEGPDHFDIRCRPGAMRRVFDNLVANGCRYGGSVRIALRGAGERVVIDVSDPGPGIAPEDAERAFAPFERLDSSRSRETGGTGLGLSISRDIVRDHGGEIAFDRAGGRFTVRVALPAGARPIAAVHDDPISSAKALS
ncbi:HAMP domain-containing histidine kinase [Sphingomonas cannabina]|uniref:sensor histidine kinase n=1 Tax=Sphingomonas cannabina TaxID=2899123 RepID=UPI001F3C5E34|nr:HAMP domain-containing sensor histidine kinase [Sphingomonas cannabina]UIJ45334.1 HAMP domain-containing histidine kinase [Sphingomonas cannabina]